jgi:hypothetical protein
MENKNFTIIEDIFDTSDDDNNDMNQYNLNPNLKSKNGMIRTLDTHSNRFPYPSSDISSIASLSYDENMIRNKLSSKINPKSLVNRQYDSMTSSNRILQNPQGVQSVQNVQGVPQSVPQGIQGVPQSVPQGVQNTNPPKVLNQSVHINNQDARNISCRSIYDHIENCPICNKYYKQSNRTYILIIIFLILIILLLIRQKN